MSYRNGQKWLNLPYVLQTREVLDAMRDDCSELEVSLLRVDGGASCNNLLMQIQADYLQVFLNHFLQLLLLKTPKHRSLDSWECLLVPQRHYLCTEVFIFPHI